MIAATPDATPVLPESPAPYGISRLRLPAGLDKEGLADLLFALPAEIGGATQANVTTAADSATVVYIDDPAAAQPKFGMIVALLVTPVPDADAFIADLQRKRWGEAKDQTLTATGSGLQGEPAFREFWRSFPPGLFALPNQPVYFLLWYRAGEAYAFMVIASLPALRIALTEALVATTGTPAATATPAS